MAESFLQQQLKLFSDNQSGPKFTLIYGNRLKGYADFILRADSPFASHCPQILNVERSELFSVF